MLRRLRHDWPVRWAHHPLCARHAQETWRIGRLHLCRGCTSLALGAVGTALAVPVAGDDGCLWAMLALAPPVLLLSWPPRYARWARAARDALRVGAGALAVLALWTTWRFPAQAWPALPLLFVLWRWFARVRAGTQARACDGCPELGAGGVCSGYARQAACVRAIEGELERELGSTLSGEGPLPPWLELRR